MCIRDRSIIIITNIDRNKREGLHKQIPLPLD
jgi:hypothetical protein